MLKIGFIILTFMITLPLGAQTFYEQLARDQDQGRLNAAQAAYIEALQVLAPDQLPESYTAFAVLPVKSATGIANRIRQMRNELNAEQQARVQTFFTRPSLETSVVSPSGLFRIPSSRNSRASSLCSWVLRFFSHQAPIM